MKAAAKPLCLFLALCLFLGGCGGGPRYEKYRCEFMGFFDTLTVIVGYALSEDEFQLYAETVYNRMEELNRLFDIYNVYDGINNLCTINQNAGIAPVAVQREVIDLLLLAREGYELTNGAVNVAMGSVLSIWHDCRSKGSSNTAQAELPPMASLSKAAALTSIDGLIIDEENGTVYLQTPGMSLDVGAVAKGYAASLAAEAARSAGARSMLLNVGGNTSSIGMPLDGVRARWGVGIQNPEQGINENENVIDTVYINDSTVSCSGDYQRFYVVDGQKYSHIIDPETLMPASLYKQVTVIHADSYMADLLSTALFILKPEEGAALAEETGAEALWIFMDGSRKATDGYIKISKEMGGFSAVD